MFVERSVTSGVFVDSDKIKARTPETFHEPQKLAVPTSVGVLNTKLVKKAYHSV